MLSLLFVVAYWCVVAGVAFGALCLLVFIALTVDDYQDRFRDVPHVPQAQRVPPRAPVLDHNRWCRNCRVERERFKPAPPFDQDDPLEQLFLLPDAPDPRWRVQ